MYCCKNEKELYLQKKTARKRTLLTDRGSLLKWMNSLKTLYSTNKQSKFSAQKRTLLASKGTILARKGFYWYIEQNFTNNLSIVCSKNYFTDIQRDWHGKGLYGRQKISIGDSTYNKNKFTSQNRFYCQAKRLYWYRKKWKRTLLTRKKNWQKVLLVEILNNYLNKVITQTVRPYIKNTVVIVFLFKIIENEF